MEAYLQSLPQDLTEQIRLDQFLGLLNNLQQAIAERDAAFLEQRRGYKSDTIVDVLEFAESRKIYNIGTPLFPSEREDLWKIWHVQPTPLEVLLTGAQGTFKSTTAAISTSYTLYLLSILWNPQLELHMIPSDEIFIIIQSFKRETAEDAIYMRMLRAIDNSPYFQKNFQRNKKKDAEMGFPNSITVKPITGSINSIVSKNVVGGVITEINEMKVLRNSVMLDQSDKDVMDIGQEVFRAFRNRVVGRFKSLIEAGGFLGRIIIDSARRYLGDFTDRKTREAKTDPMILVIEHSLWGAKPHEYEGQERFYVEKATDYRPARILQRIEDAEQWQDDYSEEPCNLVDDDWCGEWLNVIRVPESHRKDFEDDLEQALKDFGGVPSTATGRFIPYPKEIQAAQDKFIARTGGRSLFRTESVVLRKDMPWHELFDMDYIQQINVEGDFKFAFHLDTSLGRKDAAGLTFARIIDRVLVKKGFYYDKKTEEVRSVENVEMPAYCLDGVLQILAAPGDIIDMIMLADLPIELKRYIDVSWGSIDWITWEYMLQTWRNAGIACGQASMDRTPVGYFEYRHSIRDGRILIPPHSILIKETRELRRETERGKLKIEHPGNGSKDCADSAAGAVSLLKRLQGRMRRVEPDEAEETGQQDHGEMRSGSAGNHQGMGGRRIW